MDLLASVMLWSFTVIDGYPVYIWIYPLLQDVHALSVGFVINVIADSVKTKNVDGILFARELCRGRP